MTRSAGTRDHASDTDDEEFVDALQELARDVRRTADAIQTTIADYQADRHAPAGSGCGRGGT